MKITFDQHINIFGTIENENKLYKHYSLDIVPDRYDSNFIKFKNFPTLDQFKEAEQYLTKIHKTRNQNHLKFVFPQDNTLPADIKEYLEQQQYSISILELYAVKPNKFQGQQNEDVLVQFVNEHTLEGYIQLHFEDTLQWGEKYANDMCSFRKSNFVNEKINQVVAIYEDKIVGSVDLIVTELTVEIDNLYVLPTMQKKGVGSSIQHFVMDNYPNKIVILVADGEDTPREMYKKQGYEYLGFELNALKSPL